MNDAERLEKLEAAAIRAQRLSTLEGHEGWEELRLMLQEQQDNLDKDLLSMARAGTLTERFLHRYEDVSRTIRVFLSRPDRAEKKLDTLLQKVKQAQHEQGDA